MINDSPNNPTNLNIHTHDWRHNLEQPWLFRGTERIENRYYSWPQILDFHFSMLILQPFSWLMINSDPNKPINWQNRIDERWPGCEASEVYDSRPHIVDLSFLLRSSTHGHKKTDQQPCKQPRQLKIHSYDLWPSCGASLIIPEYKEEVGCTILGPRLYISPFCCKLANIFIGNDLR